MNYTIKELKQKRSKLNQSSPQYTRLTNQIKSIQNDLKEIEKTKIDKKAEIKALKEQIKRLPIGQKKNNRLKKIEQLKIEINQITPRAVHIVGTKEKEYMKKELDMAKRRIKNRGIPESMQKRYIDKEYKKVLKEQQRKGIKIQKEKIKRGEVRYTEDKNKIGKYWWIVKIVLKEWESSIGTQMLMPADFVTLIDKENLPDRVVIELVLDMFFRDNPGVRYIGKTEIKEIAIVKKGIYKKGESENVKQIKKDMEGFAIVD